MNRLLLLIALVITSFFPTIALAQSSQEIRATVRNVVIDETVDDLRHVVFTAEDAEGLIYTIDSADSYTAGIHYDLREGQDVLLQTVSRADGSQDVFLVDVVRRGALTWIVVLFAIITIAVGAFRGGMALIGLVVTVAILFGFILPRILAGADPVGITIIGGLVILAVNMHLTHGANRRTLAAFGSTAIGLGLVWILSHLFVWAAQLSGVASEEAALLFLTADNIAVPSGLLLAGIILGAVGVMDDIAITQTETVVELKNANPALDRRSLFVSAMRVGRHHIASVVNTLVLAYAGVALPLFLLFLLREDITIWRFINEELIAEELIRTLAGTTALVLLVPIATWFATYVVSSGKSSSPKSSSLDTAAR